MVLRKKPEHLNILGMLSGMTLESIFYEPWYVK